MVCSCSSADEHYGVCMKEFRADEQLYYAIQIAHQAWENGGPSPAGYYQALLQSYQGIVETDLKKGGNRSRLQLIIEREFLPSAHARSLES